MMDNIILIGFMGSGKSSVGSALAREIDGFVLDTDMILESTYKLSIKDIFERYGENEFRMAESNLLKYLISNVRDSIIASGGGFGLQGDIQKLGKVIYLDISFDALMIRFNQLESQEIEKRPLLKNKEFFKKLYDERIETYRQNAHFSVNANQNIRDIIKEIISLI